MPAGALSPSSMMVRTHPDSQTTLAYQTLTDDSASSLSPMIERRSFTGNAPDDLNSGARALRSFVRPYPMAVNGKPISIDFDVHSAVFKFVVERDGDSAANGPTEIFLPGIHYGPTSREAQSGPRRSPTTDKKRSKLVQWHEAQPNVLVKVELSSGGYEVQGEMLRWHHDRMSGPGPSRHTITVRRLGGPRHDMAYSSADRPLWRSITDTICSCVVA